MTIEEFLQEWNNDSERVLVHTSGSTGKPQPMLVLKEKMMSSARITCDFLGLHEGDTALLCMPLDYIAGKMMVVRAIERKLRLISIEPTGRPMAETKGEIYDFSSNPVVPQPFTHLPGITFAAMVPLQVFNTLQNEKDKERLMAIKQLIIGGGAVDERMSALLQDFPYAVWSTYGMTETLSHIALRRLSGRGASQWYVPFEGMQLSLDNDQCLVIDAPHVCEKQLVTHDVAELKDDGSFQFRIIGRKDNVICSGGVKIQIEEVEASLRPLIDVPFMITKRKDAKFGEVPVLLYESTEERTFTEAVSQLPRYWQPRYCMRVEHLPMTETCKPARRDAALLVGKSEC